MKHIRVETNEDELYLINSDIHAIVENTDYMYKLDDVIEIVILTTDVGPMYDDMGLAVNVGNDTAIFIMSEHRCYKDFLFNQIAKVFPIDYEKIIEASTCIENRVFPIYKRE